VNSKLTSRDELDDNLQHRVLFFADFLESLCRITTCKTLDPLEVEGMRELGHLPTALTTNPVAMKLPVLVTLLIDGVKKNNAQLKTALSNVLRQFDSDGGGTLEEQVTECVLTNLKKKRRNSLAIAACSSNFMKHKTNASENIGKVKDLRCAVKLQAIARGLSARRRVEAVEKAESTKLRAMWREVYIIKIQRFVRENNIRSERFNRMKLLIGDGPCPGGSLTMM
jgi:hypothetical protein